jgi:predicted metal-binding membrane protein
MINEFWRIPAPARRINLTVAVLIAAAWGLLVLWQRSHYAELLGHESLGDHHFSFSMKLLAFLLSWFLMTVAMMLPGSIPILIRSAQPTGLPARDFRFLVWIILGYLSPWVLFGLLAFLGDSVLHDLTETGGPLGGFSRWIAPSIALAAGLYQFTSIKWRFTQLCQTSHAIHSRIALKNLTNALGKGFGLGFFCVGSCWSLMLLMFALGHHQLGWMFVMGVIFAGERLSPWGQKLAWLVGFILLVGVSFWLLIEVFQG